MSWKRWGSLAKFGRLKQRYLSHPGTSKTPGWRGDESGLWSLIGWGSNTVHYSGTLDWPFTPRGLRFLIFRLGIKGVKKKAHGHMQGAVHVILETFVF